MKFAFIADNILDRKFEVDAPDVAWVTDITYVWTDEGWLYLAAILDLFSRRVVGHAMSERIDRALVLEALRNAVGRRVPDTGLLHHSDRGSQYASGDYQDALSERGITCSMSRNLLARQRVRFLLRVRGVLGGVERGDAFGCVEGELKLAPRSNCRFAAFA